MTQDEQITGSAANPSKPNPTVLGVPEELTATESEAPSKKSRSLVNPIALKGCFIEYEELQAPILDVSFVRVVVQDDDRWNPVWGQGEVPVRVYTGREYFEARVKTRTHGEGWVRLDFQKIVPSSRANLASFLSPKRVGESIVQDWKDGGKRHFHGLNESELWFDEDGGLLFSYLYPTDPEKQFVLRLKDRRSSLEIGTLPRAKYFELSNWEAPLDLSPLPDGDVYSRLSESRDIVTNFRPAGETEYHLKQRLLRVMSETLYSTSRNYEYSKKNPTKPASNFLH